MALADCEREIRALINNVLELDDLSEALQDQFRECKYLIVLDMGCGSVSTAVFDLEGYREADGEDGKTITDFIYPVLMDYNDINYTGDFIKNVNQPFIPAIIGFGNDLYGSPIAVVGPEGLKLGTCCENFKACPNDQNLNRVICRVQNWNCTWDEKRLRDVWKIFFEKILDRTCSWIDQRQDLVFEEKITLGANTLVMVAHPAGLEWAQPSMLASYRSLVERTPYLPADSVMTISEAKASMQYVRRKYGKALDFKKGVLIIDIGASTIDVEFLAYGESDPIEFSILMAGREADRLLGHYILERLFPEEMKQYPRADQIPDDGFFTGKNLNRSFFLYQVRLVKETLSSRERDPVLAGKPLTYKGAGQPVEVSAYILRGLLGDPTNDPLKGMVSGDRRISVAYELPMALSMQKDQGFRAVQQVSATWYRHLENITEYSLKTLQSKGHTPSRIIISGGSCLLTGIREHMAAAVTKVHPQFSDENIIYMDGPNDYESSVPFGGAYYVGGMLKYMDRLLDFPSKLTETLKRELLNLVLKELCEQISGLVFEAGQSALEWWANRPNGGSDTTARALQDTYQMRFTSIINTEGRLQKEVDTALGRISGDQLAETKQLVNNLLNDLAATSFGREVNLGNVKIQLSAQVVLPALGELDPSSMVHGLNGVGQNFWNSILNIFHRGTLPNLLRRSTNYRMAAKNNYRKPTVSEKAKVEILKELDKALDATDVFGIPDQIIRGLKESICEALYLST